MGVEVHLMDRRIRVVEDGGRQRLGKRFRRGSGIHAGNGLSKGYLRRVGISWTKREIGKDDYSSRDFNAELGHARCLRTKSCIDKVDDFGFDVTM